MEIRISSIPSSNRRQESIGFISDEIVFICIFHWHIALSVQAFKVCTLAVPVGNYRFCSVFLVRSEFTMLPMPQFRGQKDDDPGQTTTNTTHAADSWYDCTFAPLTTNSLQRSPCYYCAICYEDIFDCSCEHMPWASVAICCNIALPNGRQNNACDMGQALQCHVYDCTNKPLAGKQPPMCELHQTIGDSINEHLCYGILPSRTTPDGTPGMPSDLFSNDRVSDIEHTDETL